jgi:uncharacterized surface protein with fasciclin (FAS1) repeats
MKIKTSTISGLVAVAALTFAAAPVSAGHMPGGYYQYGGYAKHHKMPHHMHARAGHPRCHSKPMHRGYAYGKRGSRGLYGMPMHGGYGQPGGKPGHPAGSGYRGESAKAGKAAYGHGTGTKPKTGYASSQSETGPALKDIVGTASAAGDFSTLISAVTAAGLIDTLKGDGPFTVLAPNDAAFNKLPQDQVSALMGDPEALKGVLTYHVIPGRLSAADLLEQGAAETVNGATVTLAQLDVAKANIDASNGVIHVLNAVLIPLE